MAERDDVGADVDLLAASLRASSSDLETFVEVLAEKLELALPGRVRVGRQGSRLRGRQRRVARIQCDFGEQRYLLATRDGLVEARRATAVRGVVLKTDIVPLEKWLDGLARDLAIEARTSERAQRALQELLTG
jgi:hypothetical protein